MPEGHTIHRLARDLARDLCGTRVNAGSPQGRFADVARIDGRRLTAAHAVGKHLFLDFDGLRVHIHLGLFGKLRRRKPGEAPRPTVRLRLATEARIWDLTGPTACHVLDARAYEALRERLGADPLVDERRPASTWRRVQASRRPIGALLLDQSIIAGVGNVYRAELLFLVGLHPKTPGRDVPKATFDRLWRFSRELLRRGVEANRIITVPLAERRDAPRSRREQLYVYKRATCRRCRGAILRSSVGARPIYHCPNCQPASGAA